MATHLWHDPLGHEQACEHGHSVGQGSRHASMRVPSFVDGPGRFTTLQAVLLV